MVERYPPEIVLFSLGGATPLPPQLIRDTEQMPHIDGYNTTFVSQAMPDNFENVVTFQEANGLSSLPPSNMVEIQADLFTRRNPLFTQGQAVIITGNYPDETHPGLLIENTLANKNRLKLGDTLTFSISQGNGCQDVSLPVVGIYELESPIEVMNDDVVHFSQNSVIFMTYTAFQSMTNLNLKITSIKFYLDSYEKTNETLVKLNASDFDHKIYAFGISTPITIKQLIKSIDMDDNYISITIIIFVLVSVIILIILLILSLRNYYYEVGVLFAIGESKRNIFMQYLLQILISNIFAIVLSIICALAALPKVPALWINLVTKPYTEGSLLSTFDEQRNVLTTAFNTSFAGIDIVVTVFSVIYLLTIFLLFAWVVIKKNNTREIFAKNDL
jgi:ABC-type lipoprotein release transport system permease subunit